MNKARRWKAKRRRRERLAAWRYAHFWELAKAEVMPALHAEINRPPMVAHILITRETLAGPRGAWNRARDAEWGV